MVKKIFNLLPSLLLLFNFSCNDNPSQSGNNPIEPGHRDYTWEIDTLDMPMNYISSIWGASPNDIWATGAGGTYNDRLLHYDGNDWKTYDKTAINCASRSIFGFDPDNVWIGGMSGWGVEGAAVWHYDGNKWYEYYIYNIEKAESMSITDIWGKKVDEVYACGRMIFDRDGEELIRGFILHYNGNEWKEIFRSETNSQYLRIREKNNVLYIVSYQLISNANDKIEFLQYSKNGLETIYSNSTKEIGFGMLNKINNKIYFTAGKNIYLNNNGSLKKVFTVDENFGYQIYGRSSKDLFLRMKDGIAHYNGEDIKYLYQFDLFEYSVENVPVIFDEEIFFALRDRNNNKNLILHGKLSNNKK